jgi:hypothetical protein
MKKDYIWNTKRKRLTADNAIKYIYPTLFDIPKSIIKIPTYLEKILKVDLLSIRDVFTVIYLTKLEKVSEIHESLYASTDETPDKFFKSLLHTIFNKSKKGLWCWEYKFFKEGCFNEYKQFISEMDDDSQLKNIKGQPPASAYFLTPSGTWTPYKIWFLKFIKLIGEANEIGIKIQWPVLKKNL